MPVKEHSLNGNYRIWIDTRQTRSSAGPAQAPEVVLRHFAIDGVTHDVDVGRRLTSKRLEVDEVCVSVVDGWRGQRLDLFYHLQLQRVYTAR